MEHGAPHAKAVYMATGLVREVAGSENWQKLPELLQGCLKITRLVTVISQPPPAESMSARQQEEAIASSLSGLT